MPARTLIAINCQSLFSPHLTIIMVFSGRSAICHSNGIFRDRTMPAELVDLNRILLTLARSREFPDGSSRHGYDFIAPLDPEGHIDPILWKKCRDYCRVRRFWVGEDDEVGRLVHKPGGAEHARRVFEYDPGRDDDDEVGYKLGEHAFLPGDYVSIGGFLGVSGHLVAVPYDSLVIDDTGQKITLPGASKDELKKLSQFNYPAS